MSSIHTSAVFVQAGEHDDTDKASSTESWPSSLFEYGSGLYWQFLHALLDGLNDYEHRQEGYGHATTPLPAA